MKGVFKRWGGGYWAIHDFCHVGRKMKSCQFLMCCKLKQEEDAFPGITTVSHSQRIIYKSCGFPNLTPVNVNKIGYSVFAKSGPGWSTLLSVKDMIKFCIGLIFSTQFICIRIISFWICPLRTCTDVFCADYLNTFGQKNAQNCTEYFIARFFRTYVILHTTEYFAKQNEIRNLHRT